MERTPSAFVVLMLSWLSQTSVLAQIENEQQAIDALINVSKQIEGKQEIDAQKAINQVKLTIPTNLRLKPTVARALALAHLAHDLESYPAFNQLSRDKNDYISHKALIYSAFKEKGGVVACTLISKSFLYYVRLPDPDPDVQQFLEWLLVVTETISSKEPLKQRLNTLLESKDFIAFKQKHKEELKLAAEIKFEVAKQLDKQVAQANQLLKQTSNAYMENRKQISEPMATLYQNIYLLMPVGGFDVVLPSGAIIPTKAKIDLTKPAIPYSGKVGGTFVMSGIYFKDMLTGTYFLASQSSYVKSYNRIMDPAILPLVQRYLQNEKAVIKLDSGFSTFMSTFSEKFKTAIENDAQLRLAVKTWMERLNQFNAQQQAAFVLGAKERAIEAKTLKILGKQVLPNLGFSPKEELEKLGAN